MSKTNWLLLMLALCVAVLLPAVLAVVPSRRERHQARLRRLAARNGMRVIALVGGKYNFPLPANQLDEPLPFDAVLYLMSGDYVGEAKAWLARRETGSPWKWLCGEPDAGSETLNQLPKDVFAAQLDERGVGVYWRERGDETTLRDVASCLNRLQPPHCSDAKDDK